MDEISKTRETYGKIASQYGKEHSDIEEVAKYADFFVSSVKGNILDIGCGPGRDSRYFGENGLFPIGIDITPEFISMAKENSPLSEFVSMDARYLAFPEGRFDGVWACASLLHLPREDMPMAIGEVYRVLKDDGLLFVSLKEGSGEKYVGERYFSYYSESEITGILEDAGFTIVSIEAEKKKDNWISVFAKKKQR
ncbi:MAG: class I SAM-dependent methyltransferase [Candidatus Aenigmarchaeota archaeon]|nr:class I SAM-dependent methyltransferase [Candidatus Aenigmarchaeota archaeon]